MGGRLGIIGPILVMARSLAPGKGQRSMKAWVDRDDHGRQRLTRQGEGRVTAVTPVESGHFRVEIEVDLPHRVTRAVRYRTHAVLTPDHPLLEDACESLAWGSRVIWAIEWVPRAGIPADVPIQTLDLTAEADARLVALNALVALPDPVSARMNGDLT